MAVAEMGTPVLALPEQITPNLAIQAPLGSDAHGPGVVLISPASLFTDLTQGRLITTVLTKWAQEGYTVAHLILSKNWSDLRIRDELREATEALSMHPRCSGKCSYGVIGRTIPLPRS
jgi:carboxymethylenebutenolidase